MPRTPRDLEDSLAQAMSPPMVRTPLVSDIVESNVRWHPDEVAVIEGDRSLTWHEFAELVARLRQGLTRAGVTRGSRTAVVGRNSTEIVAMYHALAGLGAVLVPISWRFKSAEIAYILAQSKCSLIVADEEFMDTVRDAVSESGSDATVVVRDGEASHGKLAWDALVERDTWVEESRPVDWNDPHLIIYTSGTTGRPKGALLTHRRTMLDGVAAIAAFEVKRRERFLCWLPLFHTGGWDHMKPYLLLGGAVVLLDGFDADRTIHAIERHRCTGTFGFPLVLQAMLEAESLREADLSSMRRILYAGFDPSDLVPNVIDALRARGAVDISLKHNYGLTEGGPFVAVTPGDAAHDSPQAVGLPLPGVDMRLLDEEQNEVPRGEAGEICLRSPALMDGYLDNSEATAEIFRGGWLHTGDVGRIGEDGLLYIVDRKKDMVRTAGENVYPKEVEQILVLHEAVRDCAVIGKPDERFDERVVAVVVAQPGTAPTAEELIEHTRRHIAGYKAPREVHFVDELPKTPAGKTQKNLLRERFGSVFATRARAKDGE